MDRIDFSKSINVDPVTQIKNFFDEVMAMYNVVDGVEYKYINGVVNDTDGSISFNVVFDNEKDATTIAYRINNKIAQFCNCNFRIDAGASFKIDDGVMYGNNELEVRLIKI